MHIQTYQHFHFDFLKQYGTSGGGSFTAPFVTEMLEAAEETAAAVELVNRETPPSHLKVDLLKIWFSGHLWVPTVKDLAVVLQV